MVKLNQQTLSFYWLAPNSKAGKTLAEEDYFV